MAFWAYRELSLFASVSPAPLSWAHSDCYQWCEALSPQAKVENSALYPRMQRGSHFVNPLLGASSQYLSASHKAQLSVPMVVFPKVSKYGQDARCAS